MAKLMIVDDEVMIREVVREYAVISGYDVVEANDGIEALEIFEKDNIDIVILDIMMPRLDGFATCRRIKELKDVPIIMLSARQE